MSNTTIPTTPTIDPTLRSMPARMIGKAMPTARMPTCENPISRSCALPSVRNSGDRMEKTTSTSR